MPDASEARRPLVSILVPVRNAAATLETTLQSAFAQTHTPREIVAVDDGSTDGSAAILERHADRLRFVRQANRGGCAARNRLLAMSSGAFVQYLDADDVLDPGKIAAQLLAADAVPEAAVVLDTMRLFVDDPAEDGTRFAPAHADWWVRLIAHEIPYTTAALWRREAIRAVGGWDEGLPCGQEYDLYFRLLRDGRLLHLADHGLTRFRMPSRHGSPKREPRETIARRLSFLDRIEAHLALRNELSRDRRAALVRQRLEMARRLWHIDRPVAIEIGRALPRRGAVRMPPSEALPRRYLASFAAVGFCAAEGLADLVRARRPAAAP